MPKRMSINPERYCKILFKLRCSIGRDYCQGDVILLHGNRQLHVPAKTMTQLDSHDLADFHLFSKVDDVLKKTVTDWLNGRLSKILNGIKTL